MDQAAAEREYLDRRPEYEALVARLRELLPTVLAQSSIPVAQIEGRAKDKESFADKIRRESYDDPVREMKDLAGLRIVTYYHDDVYRVTKLIRKEFDVDDAHSTDKMEDLKVDEFGYRSFHLVCTLGDTRTALIEWKPFESMYFEIQVRSVLQHAWAAISHELDYKSTTEAPRPIRRQLFRLSALLELADEEFALLRGKAQGIIASYKASMEKGNLAVPVDLESLREYFGDKALLESWHDTGLAAGMEQAPAEIRDDEGDLRRLHAVLDALGVRNLGEMQRLLEDQSKRAVELLRPLVDKVSVYAVPLDVAALTITLGEQHKLPRGFELPSFKSHISKVVEELLSEGSK